MMQAGGLRPILVSGGEPETAAQLVFELRRLGYLAIWMDSSAAALEAIEAISFAVVIVIVTTEQGWTESRRLAAAVACPVVVGTRYLARDGRYRRRAFRSGVAAYMSPPYARTRLRQMLKRVLRGDTGIELTAGAEFYPSNR
jgi:DNA-binding response OmpR family regulator